jgi:hypothetical protein
MGEYQTDAGPMDAIRTHLKAIRTESARRDPKERGADSLAAARERLARRLGPLPQHMAALSSRVTAKLEGLGETLRPSKDAESDLDGHCGPLMAIAIAAYEIGEDSTDFDDQVFWHWFGDSIADQYIEECGPPPGPNQPDER